VHRAANTSALTGPAPGTRTGHGADAGTDPALAEFMAIKARVEQHLETLLPPGLAGPERLIEAMQYSLLSPAKRARAILTVLSALQFGAAPGAADTAAAAIEMVHAASLILDDLPSMDNAALRRGKATNHRVFGEDTAILAAVGLMNHAYQCVASDAALTADCRTELVAILTRSIGNDGLVGGQEQDMREAGSYTSAADVTLMHGRKTGALFAAAAEAGACVAGVTAARRAAMAEFGMRVGLAFQTYDDLLDAHAPLHVAGKDIGQDAAKVTLITLLGRPGAEAAARDHVAAAEAALQRAGGDTALIVAFVGRLVASLQSRTASGPGRPVAAARE
jgi:geranylgeranyl diphosphate synthase, type II